MVPRSPVGSMRKLRTLPFNGIFRVAASGPLMEGAMKISATKWRKRRAWELDNETLALTLMQGGGHLAAARLADGPAMNPYWTPKWPTAEPWSYRPSKSDNAEDKLLASLCGHNICLGFFGGPSAEEAAAGMTVHGEAPVARWEDYGQTVTRDRLVFVCGCDLPAAQMRLIRTVTTRRGSNVIRIHEEIVSLSGRDLPFTSCQHVTFGAPFLEKGVTVFDMSATKGHTFPGVFSKRQRLKGDTAFVWPQGPGVKGAVNLRTIGREFKASSDFSAQLMDPRREDAWFSAVHPGAGLMVAYVWKRADYPWLGNWEENFARETSPWRGRELTRGMEFSNTPFPIGLREAVERGTFQGQPTYRWLPALGRVAVEYAVVIQRVPQGCQGVADIRAEGEGFGIDLVV